MPVVRFTQSIAAGATFSPNLSPYDRFGGGGGKMRLQSTVQSTGVQADVLETVFVGSELVENRGRILDVELDPTRKQMGDVFGLADHDQSAGAGMDDVVDPLAQRPPGSDDVECPQ